MDFPFRINLRGIIDLLSNHLYSGPEVFLRELLQNGVDAIRARELVEPGHRGEMAIEVTPARADGQPSLSFVDNGIGLNEEEIHRFLATIGQSSKSGEFWERPEDFIGRFGIGLLSCFVVSDEIVVITRSAKSPDAPTIEWRGRPDGTYSIKILKGSIEPGTQVYLTCRKDCEEHFEPETVIQQATHYGGLLPQPIRVICGKKVEHINEGGIPWRREFATEEERREALLDFGRKTFNIEFIDFIPLFSDVGHVDGIAFVLPFSPSLATKRQHRVYLKQMLLSENAENLLPEWAFFVKCVVNANDLRPTASRESFYEDDRLSATREALGGCLREYLVRMARYEPARLQKIIRLHDLSIKALAIADDDFFKLFIDSLIFETSLGRMSFGEFRRKNDPIRFAATVDEFRQIAPVAAAQNVGVLNAGYVYEIELMAKFETLFPQKAIERINPTTLAQSFGDLADTESAKIERFLKVAGEALAPFQCLVEAKKFQPKELPALYTIGEEAEFRRGVDRTREISSSVWGDVLGNLADAGLADTARLCFNFNNPLVRKLAGIRDRELIARTAEMLYVQALLLGHRPLNSREMKLLNRGLIGLIELALERTEPPQ